MLKNGMFIADRYEIVGKVGTGGMSDVYKAKDHTLGRYVAIKVLKPEFSEDMTFVTKFRTEAQSAAGLEHPNIVNIYDVGSENGFYYIVMEYVEGITLKTYIEKKGQLNYKETLSIAIQVGRGIQAAHAKNIIHRDIKPQNIIISTDGKVKVTDFGIARAVSEHTIHSDVMGSVHYASPEQARNGYVSSKSDIYSLGIVMYEMVTGRVPFDGDSTVAVAIQHLQDEMVPPSTYAENLPVSLEKIIQKCTQKSPDRRYDSMESLLVDLRKSLLSPNEDFVTLVPFNQDKTRVLTNEEIKEIQEKTSNVAPEEENKRYVPDDDDDDYDDDYDDDDYDDDDEEEGRFLNSRMEKIVSVMRIVVAVIIVAIVVYFVGSFFDIFKFGPGNKKKNELSPQVSQEMEETIEMIDLTGMTVEEAEEKLEGITIKVKETKASADYEKDQIMDQDVREGETIAVGSTVNVTLSSGEEEPEDIKIEDVTGNKAESAVSILEAQGLKVSKEFEHSNDVEAGRVIRQDPKGGSTIKENSTVTIYVSRGTESAKVPDVRGKTQAEAEAALAASELKAKITTQNDDSVEAGKVISQSVEGGKYVDKNTEITLVISSGPKAVSYYIKSPVKAPSNVTPEYADIELYGADSDKLIEKWGHVTDFPYTIEKHGISEPSGIVVITWYYYDDEGELQSDTQDEQPINFNKE